MNRPLRDLEWTDHPRNFWEGKWSGREARRDVIIVGGYLILMFESGNGRKPVA